jgi:hypothetical protein
VVPVQRGTAPHPTRNDCPQRMVLTKVCVVCRVCCVCRCMLCHTCSPAPAGSCSHRDDELHQAQARPPAYVAPRLPGNFRPCQDTGTSCCPTVIWTRFRPPLVAGGWIRVTSWCVGAHQPSRAAQVWSYIKTMERKLPTLKKVSVVSQLCTARPPPAIAPSLHAPACRWWATSASHAAMLL